MSKRPRSGRTVRRGSPAPPSGRPPSRRTSPPASRTPASPGRPLRPFLLAGAVVLVGILLVAGYTLGSAGTPQATPSPSQVASASASGAAPASGSAAASASVAPSSAAGSGSSQPSGSTATLPGLQTGPPPWPPETASLRARLDAIGLPALSAEGTVLHTHQHLDILIEGQAVAVPADIGISLSEQFIAPVHTHDATGIIHVESPTIRDFTLGQFFDVWGVRFDQHCIGGACDGNGRTLTVFVNGRQVSGDPRAIKLEPQQEIVVALGTPSQLPNPVPSTYDFPAGL